MKEQLRQILEAVQDLVDEVGETWFSENDWEPPDTPPKQEITDAPNCMDCGLSQDKEPSVTKYELGDKEGMFASNWYCNEGVLKMLRNGSTVRRLRNQGW